MKFWGLGCGFSIFIEFIFIYFRGMFLIWDLFRLGYKLEVGEFFVKGRIENILSFMRYVVLVSNV